MDSYLRLYDKVAQRFGCEEARGIRCCQAARSCEGPSRALGVRAARLVEVSFASVSESGTCVNSVFRRL